MSFSFSVLAPEEEETLRVDIVPKAINVNREDELTLHCRVTPEPILPCVFLWTLKNKEAAFELLSIPGLVEIILKDGIETDLTVFKVTEFYTGTYTCKAFCLEDAPFATATINFCKSLIGPKVFLPERLTSLSLSFRGI